jgi:hypothetical protein
MRVVKGKLITLSAELPKRAQMATRLASKKCSGGDSNPEEHLKKKQAGAVFGLSCLNVKGNSNHVLFSPTPRPYSRRIGQCDHRHRRI